MKQFLWIIPCTVLYISSLQAATVFPGPVNILDGPVFNPATAHSYFLLTSSPWTDAEAAAVSLGGHLVTVNDAAENDWLLSTFSNFGGKARALWTGLTDRTQQGVFRWSSGEPVAYTRWEVGQPDDGGGFYPHEDYVLIWPSPGPRSPGFWNDYINTNTFTQLALQVFGVVEVVPNNWTNPASAKWESPSWSLGQLPGPNQTVNIVNDGYKAVNIDGTTVANFPSSLTVGSLQVSAPTNGLSTLLLNYFGFDKPLKVLNSCVIGTNGTVLNLSSSFEVDGAAGGVLTIDGGTFTQEGGLTVVTPSVQVLNGSLNATNATMNLGPLQINGVYPQFGRVYQSGGTLLSSAVNIGRGGYLLSDGGTLYSINGTTVNDANGGFIQTGGSNFGDLHILQGAYQMSGGLLQGNNMETVTPGSFTQNGGTVRMQNLSVRGPGAQFPILPSYLLSTGVLYCSTLEITHYGRFLQSGIGTLFLTNRLNLFDPSGDGALFELDGANAFMSSLVVSNGGKYIQSSGTNQVSGDIIAYNNGLALYGGLLSSANTGIGESGLFLQQGGIHEVSGVLSVSGTYSLQAGTLSVNGIYTRGAFVISRLVGPPPVLNNTGLINFGGNLFVSVSQYNMGRLGLSAEGSIYLNDSPITLKFGDSSALNWNPVSQLTIEGWSGSNSGNGAHQIYFGNSTAGLTPGQVAQIRFLNPQGAPPGYYPARILPTGELVPVSAPDLQTVRLGNQLYLTWTGNYQLLTATNVLGPYEPVSGATSPYASDVRSAPQRFFKLQGQ